MKRDYKVLTRSERDEWDQIREKEVVEKIGNFPIRKDLFHEYPKAARHHMHLFPNQYLDIMELQLADSLNNRVSEFQVLLDDSDTTERHILNHINNSESLLIIGSLLKKYYNFGHHEAHAFREFPLGTSYKVDYLLVGRNSDGWHFVFIELEAPSGSVTVNNGDFGAVFRKGKSQIDDWDLWLEQNYGSLQEYFQRHKKPDDTLPEEYLRLDKSRINYVVVAGRRTDFNDRTYRLQRTMRNNDQVLMIHYDNMIDAAKSLINCQTY